MTIVTKRCSKCKREFPATLDYFQSQKTRKDGLHSWCKECKRGYKEGYHKDYYQANKQTILERVKSYARAFPERQQARHRKWYAANKELSNQRVKENHRKTRLDVIAHYGGKCVCCGETQIEFLAIDHINGGGRKHRASINNSNMYHWLKKNNYPDGFQILCHNCNMAKGFYGQCPHQNIKA